MKLSYVLEAKNIHKTFNNTIKALQGVNLEIKKGEIHALCGENAAGKSTLMNILYGMFSPDMGEIWLDGKICNITHPADAIDYGIGMVHQHFQLIPDFTALENIILGKEKKYTNAFGNINYNKAREDVEKILEKLDIEMDLNKKAGEMTIGFQSKIEIVKTLFRGAKIIIFDEPTTVLAPNEVQAFLDFIKKLRDQGFTMIYISHRMKEIFEICDTITVLRKGEVIATVKTRETDSEEIGCLMLNREINCFSGEPLERIGKIGKPVLEMKGVSMEIINNLNLTIHENEVVGIAGIEGNGQIELSDTLIGVKKNLKGQIVYNGEVIGDYTPTKRRNDGIRYIPEDRIRKGMAFDMSLTENAIMGYENEGFVKSNKHMVSWEKADRFTSTIVEEFNVEGMKDVKSKISNLSGGNMQKLIIGRELITNPSLAILAQPTVGVDFGTQRHIHEKIMELRNQGSSIMVISADLDELMALSDRILVIYRGKIVKEFNNRNDFDDKEIGLYMLGVKGYEN